VVMFQRVPGLDLARFGRVLAQIPGEAPEVSGEDAW